MGVPIEHEGETIMAEEVESSQLQHPLPCGCPRGQSAKMWDGENWEALQGHLLATRDETVSFAFRKVGSNVNGLALLNYLRDHVWFLL